MVETVFLTKVLFHGMGWICVFRSGSVKDFVVVLVVYTQDYFEHFEHLQFFLFLYEFCLFPCVFGILHFYYSGLCARPLDPQSNCGIVHSLPAC